MPSATVEFDRDVILEELPDLAASLSQWRARKPAVWGLAFGEPTLLLLSHRLVHAAFEAEDVFPAADFYGRVVTDVMGRNVMCLAGEEHRRGRALVSPAFRPRLMAKYVQSLLEPAAHELIDQFISRGEADLVAEVSRRYPFLIITRLLGLPRHSEEQIRYWALTMMDVQQNHPAALQASQEFVSFVDPILQRRRGNPADDLISMLATAEVDGERLTDEEVFDFLKLLFPAGADTTYLGMGSTLFHLLANPDQLALVRSDPQLHARWAADEAMRLDPPNVWIPRRSPTDTVWQGIEIPAGSPILLGVMAGNRDPAVYEAPDEFRVGRRPRDVLTFGYGAHFCLGSHLARAEIDTVVRILLRRLANLRLADPGGVRMTGTIHHLFRGPDRLPVVFDAA